MVLVTFFKYGKVETGFAEPPRQVDIDVVLRAAGVQCYDNRRVPKIYLRYICKNEIYDSLSIRELEQLCRDRNIPLQDMPSILPGPVSHPWVQEGFKRLHARLVEALEKPENATTFHRFHDLPKGVRLNIYRIHFDQMKLITFTGEPAITKTSHMVRKEALSVYFDRSFELHTRTEHSSIPSSLLPAPMLFAPFKYTRNFLKAPPSYANRVRRLVVYRWFMPQGTVRADHGTWRINLDAVELENRVCWVPEAGHGEGFEEGAKKVKMEIAISDATLRLRNAVDTILKDDGKLFGEDAKWLRHTIESAKGEHRPRG